MKTAVITLRVPLNPRFPWKPIQGTLEEGCIDLVNAACDGVTWHDAKDPGRGVQTHVSIEDGHEAARMGLWQRLIDRVRTKR